MLLERQVNQTQDKTKGTQTHMAACKELGEVWKERKQMQLKDGGGGGGVQRGGEREALGLRLASRGQRGDKPRGPRLTLVGLQSYHLSKSWLGQPPPRPLPPTPTTSLNHPSDPTVSPSESGTVFYPRRFQMLEFHSLGTGIVYV